MCIRDSRYGDVYARVMQWNSTHDVYETIVQLEELVEDSKKSTDGQVWLNFALATIGVLLTLFASPGFNWQQVISLALLALASVMYAFYARNGQFAWQVTGWLLSAMAILV